MNQCFPNLRPPTSLHVASKMSDSRKRRNDNHGSGMKSNKKSKNKVYWSKSVNNYQTITGIETGSEGIFATCDRGTEPKCVAEMYRLLEQCALKLYGLKLEGNELEDGGSDQEEDDEDIEASINREILSLKKPKPKKLIMSIKLDIQCVVFFRTKVPCVPTEMVYALLEDKAPSKWTHRLTPVTRTGKATLEGLEEVAKEVLKPHFHEGQEGVKFCIRPTTRQHNVLNRDQVIKVVADVVGPKHKVDIKNHDVLILVEIYKNMCGISVVRDFEKLKKYNLSEVLKIARDNANEGIAGENEKSQEVAGQLGAGKDV